MNKEYIVYVHTNMINNKSYVGITCRNPYLRWGKEGNGYKGQPKFYNAIQKYGWKNFEHTILATQLTQEEALELETSYIKQYDSIDNGYNILLEGIKSYPRNKPVYCLTTQTLYESITQAAEECNVTPYLIIANIKGKNGGTKGLSWAYWDKNNNTYIEPKKFVSQGREKQYVKIYCIELNKYFPSIASACKQLGLQKSGLLMALSGTRNGIKGLHFVRANELYKIPQVMKKKTGRNRPVYCEETEQVFCSLQEAAQFASVTVQSIMRNCQGKNKTCAGYHFKYFNEVFDDLYIKKQGLEEEDE